MTTRKSTDRPHVLIVGDDQDLSTFLSEGLMMGGFWTSTIASGIQAIEVFRLRGFDLVLIDALIGGMDVVELTRRLRMPGSETSERTDVPLFIIAGSLDEVDPEAISAAGSDGLLLPPIELETLIPALFGAVDEWRSRHPDRPWADQVAQLKPESIDQ